MRDESLEKNLFHVSARLKTLLLLITVLCTLLDALYLCYHLIFIAILQHRFIYPSRIYWFGHEHTTEYTDVAL